MNFWTIASLLSLPSGLVGPRARRDLNQWSAENTVAREHRYGPLRKVSLWGANRPILFTLLLAGIAGLLAFLCTHKFLNLSPLVPSMDVAEDFDVAAYIGVPWTIQATLVALVYPIVLSFVALILQRRVQSAVAMRVYVLESAVIPAGVRAVGLLIWLGLLYFLVPYSKSAIMREWGAELLVGCGIWLGANLALAGIFVSLTVRFIDSREQLNAYMRVAVDLTLREELVSSLKQHRLVSMPQKDWGYSAGLRDDKPGPIVHMFMTRPGVTQVQRNFVGKVELVDIHMNLLRLVARRWAQRADVWQRRSAERPRLYFPAFVGSSFSGVAVLCGVFDGPPLTGFEKFLVRQAFVFGRARRVNQQLTCTQMLEELASEFERLAEQKQTVGTQEALRQVTELHKALLLAGAMGKRGVKENTVTLTRSPYWFAARSFDLEWIGPYLGLARAAVSSIEDDPRLIGEVARIPVRLLSELAPKPDNLLLNLLDIHDVLIHELLGWWRRQAHAHSSTPVARKGTLPEPLNTVYQTSLVSIIGARARVRVEVASEASEEGMWDAATSGCKVLAKHIDASAANILKTIDQGDETAAHWFVDDFIKWWGTREHWFNHEHVDDHLKAKLSLTLAELSLDKAQDFLWQGGESVSAKSAINALDFSLYRYWESMRLCLILTLIHEAGEQPASDSLALRMAAALLKGTPLKDGGNVHCMTFEDVDNVLSIVFSAMFNQYSDLGRLNWLGQSRRQDSDEPMVPGWTYSFSGVPPQFEHMKRPLARLLISIANLGSFTAHTTGAVVRGQWKRPHTLEEISQYCGTLRRAVLNESFAGQDAVVSALSDHLSSALRSRKRRLILSTSLKQIGKLARYERMLSLRAIDVDDEAVKDLAKRISRRAIDLLPMKLVRGTQIHIGSKPKPNLMSFRWAVDKLPFSQWRDDSQRINMVDELALYMRDRLATQAIFDATHKASGGPVNAPPNAKSRNASAFDVQQFVEELVRRIDDAKASGLRPVVLPGAVLGLHLRPHRWGFSTYQVPPINGVNIRIGEAQDKALAMLAYINDTPVYDGHTPDQNCYVIDAGVLEELLIDGEGDDIAVSVNWTKKSDEQITLAFQWRASFVT